MVVAPLGSCPLGSRRVPSARRPPPRHRFAMIARLTHPSLPRVTTRATTLGPVQLPRTFGERSETTSPPPTFGERHPSCSNPRVKNSDGSRSCTQRVLQLPL